MSDTMLSISQGQRKAIAEKEQAPEPSSAHDPAVLVSVSIAVIKHNQRQLGGKGLLSLLFYIVIHH